MRIRPIIIIILIKNTTWKPYLEIEVREGKNVTAERNRSVGKFKIYYNKTNPQSIIVPRSTSVYWRREKNPGRGGGWGYWTHEPIWDTASKTVNVR